MTLIEATIQKNIFVKTKIFIDNFSVSSQELKLH